MLKNQLKGSPWNVGRIIALVAISFFLSNTFIIGFLSPLPLVIVVVVYGRLRGYIATIATFIFSIALLFYSSQNIEVSSLMNVTAALQSSYYLILFSMVLLCSETVLRGWHPCKTISWGGGLLFLFSMATIYAGFKLNNMSLQEFFTLYMEQGKEQIQQIVASGEQDIELVSLLTNPVKLAQYFKEQFFYILYLIVMLSLWTNLALSLKVNRFFNRKGYKYSESDLINFKMPDYFIYGLITALILYLAGDSFLGMKIISDAGRGLFYVFGLFYFFKGFGIFLHFFDMVGIFGFLRTLFVMLSVLTLKELIAILGILDFWLDLDNKILNNIKKSKGV